MHVRGLLILTQLLLVALASVSAASADPFYLRYDADETFPEQEGWTRYWSDPDGTLIRTVEHGIFRLDTRASTAIFDLYELVSQAFILDPGEELHVTWRMQTLETQVDWYWSDVLLGVVNADHAFARLFLGPDFVSADERPPLGPERLYEFQGGIPHTFAFVSTDMLEYDLYVDGVHAFRGLFEGYAWRECPRIAFGDAVTGRSSLSEWDYLEVAVIPEPSGLGLFVGLALLCIAARRF